MPWHWASSSQDGREHCLVRLSCISIAFPGRLQPLTSPANSSPAEMTDHSPSDPLKKLRGMSIRRRNTFTPSRAQPHNHNSTAGILAASGSVLAFGPSQPRLVPILRKSTDVSVYRHTSDVAQTFLPPVQAVADVIPGVGGIIKGVIGGILGTLQLVDVIRFRCRVLLSLMLNRAIIETHPEQGRHGGAQTTIAPPSPPYRRGTHCSVLFRANHETAVAQVCGSREAWFN